MVDVVLAADPRLDVLVNNAGGGVMSEEAFGDPLDGGNDDWAAAFALNLDAAVRTVHAALPALVKARGAVVNISSDSSRRPGSGPLPYSAAKAALNVFTRVGRARGGVRSAGQRGVAVSDEHGPGGRARTDTVRKWRQAWASTTTR